MVWTETCTMLAKAPFTRYSLLSNRLSNRFDNHNRFDNRLYRVYKHSTGCQTHLTTGLTNGCIVCTAGYQTGCTTRFDNRLNEQWLFIQHGFTTRLTTSLTTSWMFVYTIQLDRAGCTTGVTTGCTTGLTAGCIV